MFRIINAKDITHELRLSGYIADDESLVCYKDGKRYEQERTAVVRLIGDREMIDKLVEAADSPRALLGRQRGSAVLVFRSEGDYLPFIAGDTRRNGIVELAQRSDGSPLTIIIGSEGQTVDIQDYKWTRSPLEIERDRLPVLTSDISQAIVDEAFKLDCTWIETVKQDREVAARVEKFRADVAAGRVKIQTPEEIAEAAQARSDASMVEANLGRDINWADGNGAQLVLAARGRHEARQRAKQNAA
ncbi:MAG: hypothetical protein ACLPTF_19575 [Steroidobacteraceae bacterium]